MKEQSPKQKIYKFLMENQGLYFKTVDIVRECDVVRGSAYYALNALAAEGIVRCHDVVKKRWGIPHDNTE